MYEIYLIATWTSPFEGSLLFINEIYEADSAEFNKIRSQEAGSIVKDIIKVSYL